MQDTAKSAEEVGMDRRERLMVMCECVVMRISRPRWQQGSALPSHME